MIPEEVAAIADIIMPNWAEAGDGVGDEVILAAWRLYNAGYRKQAKE